MSAEVVRIAPDALPARPATDTWVDVVVHVVKLAKEVADTDFVPRGLRGNVPAITAAILHGRELGLAPMTALALTHVIDGRPTMSAEAQRGLVRQAGHDIEFTELSDAVVTCRGRRNGEERWTPVTWTLERARQAGLANKQPWRAYPRAMLAARASAELCRLMFSDVVHGMMATEELEGEPETTAPEPRKRTVTRAPAPPPPEIPPPPPPPAERPTEPATLDPDAVARQIERVLKDAESASSPDETDPAPPRRVTPAQLRMLGAVWSKFHVTDDERRAFTATLVGRDLEGSTKNLTVEQASNVLAILTRILTDAGDDTDAARAALLREVESADE